MENTPLTVSDFVALVNQTLEYAYPSVMVIGEVAEFRISQGKWVTFKLKDAESVVECFMVLSFPHRHHPNLWKKVFLKLKKHSPLSPTYI
jgi:exonuclease VII large subunit